ncbi:MAG: hypothetical protein P9L92_18485 [Candidatus Electryonea clarkiae]|nr:hypothetical protein [Candidatus Electryonea clarkiae]MDP8286362.1 hypothetical protein [Candidatus Electryonea clarkiae]
MKWLLLLAVYFFILWVWRKLSGFLKQIIDRSNPVNVNQDKVNKKKSNIDTGNIEDAHYTEINNDE